MANLRGGQLRSAREHEETFGSVRVRVFDAGFGLHEEAIQLAAGDDAADHDGLTDRDRRHRSRALDVVRQVDERRQRDVDGDGVGRLA